VACPAGYYGGTQGLSTSACTGQCDPGYYCTGGSSSSTQFQCNPGFYCPLGSPSQTACPAGTYGATAGLQNNACSGLCNAGYYCFAGSTSATQVGPSVCWLAFVAFTDTETQPYVVLRPVQYACPAGRWGVAGLSSPTCSGLCNAGYFCTAGSPSGSCALACLAECMSGLPAAQCYMFRDGYARVCSYPKHLPCW
jgi:hypothetical protein